MYEKDYRQKHPEHILAAADEYWEKYGFNSFYMVPWGWEYQELSDVLFSMTIEKSLPLFAE